jgi:D-alanyl-D-alanine carboxypeptidase/D-alanyl-D-alanine-endopeptidase (penicillin-binding protein 4)
MDWMKRTSFLLKTATYLVMSHTVIAQAIPASKAAIPQWIQQATDSVNMGALVIDPSSNTVLYQKDANHYFTPASVLKLFTATAAWYALGIDYRYQTTLAHKGNNYYFRFTGDPSLTTDDLKQLVKSLKQAQVQNISGNIIFDTTRFSAPDYPPGMSYEDSGWYYAAPIHAIILNRNNMGYIFDSTGPIGSAVKVHPYNSAYQGILHIQSDAKIVSAATAKQCDMNVITQGKNHIVLTGCVAQTQKPYSEKLAIPDPTLLAMHLVKSMLAAEKISFNGKMIPGKMPADATVMATHSSAPLSKLITRMLQHSDNIYANAIAKTIGYTVTGSGSFKNASFAIKKILLDHNAIDKRGLIITDGAGNRLNLVTPNTVVKLLKHIYQNKPLYTFMLTALPKSGVSGTLGGRMVSKPLKGNVVAKTGGMHDITALAGFMFKVDGKTLIFAIISNDVTTGIQKIRQFEARFLARFS